MPSTKQRNRILVLESLGFLAVISASWLDELTNLSSWIFADAYTPNWHEAVFETAVVVLVAVPILYFTWKTSRRLHELEGFLKLCAWCRRIDDDGNWISIEEFVQTRLDTRTSHGVCPDCHAKMVAGLRK